jgi:hypothetical protein
MNDPEDRRTGLPTSGVSRLQEVPIFEPPILGRGLGGRQDGVPLARNARRHSKKGGPAPGIWASGTRVSATTPITCLWRSFVRASRGCWTSRIVNERRSCEVLTISRTVQHTGSQSRSSKRVRRQVAESGMYSVEVPFSSPFRAVAFVSFHFTTPGNAIPAQDVSQ